MSTGKIKLAEGLVLPDNAATQVFAFMGRRGSGKTYGAGKFVEELLDAGHQVVVLDPVGVWWGLRLAADGQSPGIKIPVLGGIHGDGGLALEATAGKVVADLVAAQRTSLVLDVSEFSQAEQGRFVADFATELFAAKKRHRSALMVVLDEAQDFCPQQPEPGEARMLGAIQRMAKLGRNFGIGLALLSQRPQEVSKKVLNLSEVLLAFQLNGTHERKAISAWVQEKGDDARADIGLELPSLPIGTAMVWSPQWLNLFGKFKILEKWTYDSSATPDQSTVSAGTALAPIDLELLRQAMAESIDAARQNDPKELRAEVASLRRQLEDAGRAAQAPKEVRVEVKVPFVPDGVLHHLRRALEAAEIANGRRAPPTARAYPPPPPAPLISPDRRAVAALERRVRERPNWGIDRPAPPPPREPADLQEAGGPAGVLQALAAAGGRAPKRQLATLAGIRPTVSTFRNYMVILKRDGLVEADGDELVLTAKGRARAGTVSAKSPAELLAMWLRRLHSRPGQILSLLAAEPGPFTKEQIQRRCNIPPGQSTLRNYLSVLRGNDLVRRVRGGLVVNPLLRHY